MGNHGRREGIDRHVRGERTQLHCVTSCQIAKGTVLPITPFCGVLTNHNRWCVPVKRVHEIEGKLFQVVLEIAWSWWLTGPWIVVTTGRCHRRCCHVRMIAIEAINVCRRRLRCSSPIEVQINMLLIRKVVERMYC